jgi:hypothetical protein
MSEDAKPRTEVVEETRETLSVIEQDRMPRPEKAAAELAFFDGAHEVRFTERTFRPKHAAALDDVRAFVDSLEVRRRELPPLPAPPAHGPVAVEDRIPEHFREPLERVIRGALVKVETVHRVGTGTVVDVEWEAKDEGLRKGLYLIDDEGARPFETVASKVDELPAPRVRAQTTPAAPTAAAPQPPAEKRSRFGLGRKEKKPGAPPPEPAVKADEPAKKRRFGFGRK